jgi:hypothetical protein
MTSTQKKIPANNVNSDVLAHLNSPEAAAVLGTLLERHKNLRAEAEEIATELVASPSVDDIAKDMLDAVTSLDIDDLNDRAGPSQYGYTEPSEAAYELLEESVEDFLSDMKRRMKLGLTDAAIAICCGIVKGLHKAKRADSDVLNWEPDFPEEEASQAVAEFMKSCPKESRQAVSSRLLAILSEHVPAWSELFSRAARENVPKAKPD